MARLTLILGVLATVIYLLDGFRFMLNEWRNWRNKGKWLVVMGLCLMPSLAQAACTGSSPTWTATADESSIQTCFTNAISSDTVNIGAGTASITTPLSITGKKLTVVGNGVASTIISNSTGSSALFATVSATNFVDISQITFQEVISNVNGIVRINGTIGDVAFRFHHNEVLHNTIGGRGIFVFDVYGLIDHVRFDSGSASAQSLSIQGSNNSADGGWTPWSTPLSLGTINAVYVEDSSFTNSTLPGEDSIDAYDGTRLVSRYNTFNNTHAGFHGTDSGDQRSPISVEIYNNQYNNSTVDNYEAGRMRGGTGVWFNNTWTNLSTGTWGDIGLFNYRACSDSIFTWQACNGTQYVVGSSVKSSDAIRRCCDISTSPTPGVGGCAAFPTINWIGDYGFDATNQDTLPLVVHGTGNSTAFFDGSGTGGYPCRDQVGRAPSQVLEPVYAWNNTGGQILVAVDAWGTNCGGFGLANYLLENRDFYNNTPRPGYTSFTYPHPLQGITDTSAPSPVVIARVMRWMEVAAFVTGMGWHFRKQVMAVSLATIAGCGTLYQLAPRSYDTVKVVSKELAVKALTSLNERMK